MDVSREQRRQRRIERVEKRCQEKAKKFLTSDRLLEDKTYLTNLSRGRSQRARKFKKVQAKKHVKSNKSKNLFREIAFLALLNFFPVQKLIFGHF